MFAKHQANATPSIRLLFFMIVLHRLFADDGRVTVVRLCPSMNRLPQNVLCTAGIRIKLQMKDFVSKLFYRFHNETRHKPFSLMIWNTWPWWGAQLNRPRRNYRDANSMRQARRDTGWCNSHQSYGRSNKSSVMNPTHESGIISTSHLSL